VENHLGSGIKPADVAPRVGGLQRGGRKGRKVFFFEKKKQKTFIILESY
jgi:hypothetical protein